MMTPGQKVKWLICENYSDENDFDKPPYPCDNIDDIYDELVEKDNHWDSMHEVRYGEIETDIKSEYSRHYESKSVAAKMPDGEWVGWTYWFGGGKHGEPEAIEWISEAYDLDCEEEEKLIIVRSFTKKS